LETKKKMPYEWLLFDADNTLFDYDKAEAFALEKTFTAFQLAFDVTFSAQYREINAQIWHDYELGNITQDELRTERFRRLFTSLGIKTDTNAFSERYLQNLARGGFLIDGAEALIKRLHADYRLAIITNGIGDVQHPRFNNSTIANYIETMVVSGDLGVAKPDPAIFDIAFRHMGDPAKEAVLIIGDSLSSDMQGGINYGIDTCWYNPGGQISSLPITYEIRELADLPRILNGSAG
jgi:YjjG family noncanonical pyrimidine nucleotidase